MKTRYKYIRFEKSPVNAEGWVYDIWNNRRPDLLGHIEYYEPWKEYVFVGQDYCVFNTDCLRDIIDFIGQLKGK